MLKEKLLEQKFLHADETTYRVLESETVKTFYWTFLSDKQAKKPITLYHHDPHCSGQLVQATLVGCWAHVRRKFFEAVPPEASNKSISNQGVRYCDRMFALEKDWENLSNQNIKQWLCLIPSWEKPLLTL